MLATQACRFCGDPIAMVRTETGRRMPLDPEPNDDGNVIVAFDSAGRPVAKVVGKNTPVPIGTRFMPHFATCPNYHPKGRR